MKKFPLSVLLFWLAPAFLFFIKADLQAQETILVNDIPGPAFNFQADLIDSIQNSPVPAAGLPDSLLSRVGWSYFWMFEGGLLSRKASVDHSYLLGSAAPRSAMVAIRARYSGSDEPPALLRSVNAPVNATPNIDSLLSATDRTGLFPNWGAARRGDTIYFALSFRKSQEQVNPSGYFQILFPRDEFELVKEIFPIDLNKSEIDIDAADILPSKLVKWRIESLDEASTRTFFVAIRAKPAARDSIAYPFAAEVDWDRTDVNPVDAGTFLNTGTKENIQTPENANQFLEEKRASIVINMARDPNALTVWPRTLPPTPAGPQTHTLDYRVDVENVGNAPVHTLSVFIEGDSGLELDYTSFSSLKFGSSVATPVLIPRFPSGAEVRFPAIMLQSSLGGANAAGKGFFTFKAKTKTGVALNIGDKIVSRATVVMYNQNAIEDDRVETGPAIVEVRKPGRLRYGTLLGIKGYANLENPDSSRNKGLHLAFQIPLINPVNPIRAPRMQNKPVLFWQLEAGVGSSAFTGPSEQGYFRTQYIHLTPLRFRYVAPRIPDVTNVGLSAGYGLDWVYRTTRNGSAYTMPAGFGNRIEHEFATSVDFLNLDSAPGLMAGVGYKYRFNKIGGSTTRYKFPFVYVQLNFAHFQHRQTTFWNKIWRR